MANAPLIIINKLNTREVGVCNMTEALVDNITKHLKEGTTDPKILKVAADISDMTGWEFYFKGISGSEPEASGDGDEDPYKPEFCEDDYPSDAEVMGG